MPDVMQDVPSVVEACLKACRRNGQRYTEAVRDAAEQYLSLLHDERERLAVIRLLAKVELLVDQQQLPMGGPKT